MLRPLDLDGDGDARKLVSEMSGAHRRDHAVRLLPNAATLLRIWCAP